MKNFNLQSMLCFMMFISITFSMQMVDERTDYIRTYTPEILEEIKNQIYPTKENYQNELERMRTKIRILTWKDNSNEILKRYHHQVVNYIPDLSNYVVYEIEWDNEHLSSEYRTQIVFFINPKTQRARIFQTQRAFQKDQNKMVPIGYSGVTEFEIETILNYPIFSTIPGGSTTKQCITFDRDDMNLCKKKLYHSALYVNYKNKKFYVTKEGYLEDVYVFTLDTLCPHISKQYIKRPKLEYSAKSKLFSNRLYKYVQYENQNTTSDQNHLLQNTNSDQLQNTTYDEKEIFPKKKKSN